MREYLLRAVKCRMAESTQEELQDIEHLEPGEQDVEAEPDEGRGEVEEEAEEPLTIRRCFSIPIDLNDDIDMINKELGSTFSSIVRVAFSDPQRYRVLLETAKKLEAGMSLEKLGALAREREAAGEQPE